MDLATVISPIWFVKSFETWDRSFTAQMQEGPGFKKQNKTDMLHANAASS